MKPFELLKIGGLFKQLGGALFAALVLVPAAMAQTTRISVAMDPADGASELLTLAVSSSPLSRLVRGRVIVLPQRDLTDAMRATRTKENDVIIAPAHVVASALTHGYTLIAASGLSSKYVLVGAPSVRSVKELQGKRGYFPSQDSLRSYVARGLLAQEGLTPRSLEKVTYAQTSGAGLLSVGNGLAEVTVALEEEWKAWSKANPGAGHVLASSAALPAGMSVAIKNDAPTALKQAVVQWVTTTEGLIPGMPDLRAIENEAPYDYVASLGIFTPAELAGVKRISAKEAFELGSQGAHLIDVRSDREYKRQTARGALHASYGEKSLKAIDFDAALDNFSALDQLKISKHEPVVFFCNGPDCWKSYKASTTARKLGYTKVYWLRGGMPEWTEQGLPTN